MKTLLDIFFATILFVLLLPLLVIVALLIFFADLRSPIFTQRRLGLQKLPFKIIKFRTMLNGEITFFGRVLRKTGIDELPQLINIIFMDMSFVGPRPLTIDDVVRLGWDTSYYDKRWSFKPGIVGLAQLAPICHRKMSWFLDLHYIKHQTLYLDAQVIMSSALIPILGKDKVKKWMHKR
ncbi:MAG: lipopolysaccharide/colanic/teichoic acid biosynthesis glycosyltransferase [Arenicella sp.]